MRDFVTLSCPSCGGTLQISKDIERFACAHCGNEHLVRRSGATVTIAPIVEGLKKIQHGTDKTAAELAIPRLRGEIASLVEELHEALSSPALVRATLQRIGKVSFLEYSFTTDQAVIQRISELSQQELTAGIQRLEQSGLKRNEMQIKLLTMVRRIKAQLAQKESQLSSNQQIADS